MTKRKVIEIGYVEHSCNLSGFLRSAYGECERLLEEAVGLDIHFPEWNFVDDDGVNVFLWLRHVGVQLDSSYNEDQAPGLSGEYNFAWYYWSSRKEVVKAASESVREMRQFIHGLIIKKLRLEDLDPADFMETLKKAAEREPLP
jgi:hypothetical protein